jgi:hypothetical protein
MPDFQRSIGERIRLLAASIGGTAFIGMGVISVVAAEDPNATLGANTGDPVTATATATTRPSTPPIAFATPPVTATFFGRR